MSRLEMLQNAVKTAKSNSSFEREDKQFYYPERDKVGNASAIIRFLPGKTDDDIPFVKTYSHGFKGPTGKWFIEDCPTTISEPCFCCEKNGELVAPFGGWDSTPNDVKDVVRQRKRKMQYVANILVIKDEKNPENEGKAFLFKFGQKIAEKVFHMISPTFIDTDEKDEFVSKFGADSVDIFDLDKGANFNLKIRKFDGNVNYDKSEFRAPSAAGVDVDLSQLEDLNQFTAPSKYKTPAEMKKRFDAAIGNTDRVAPMKAPNEDADEDFVKVVKKPAKVAESQESEDDDVAAMMAKLAAMDDDIPF